MVYHLISFPLKRQVQLRRDNTLIAYDLKTKDVIWKTDEFYSENLNPFLLILYDKYLFAAGYDLTCFDKTTGELIYKIPNMFRLSSSIYITSHLTSYNKGTSKNFSFKLQFLEVYQ